MACIGAQTARAQANAPCRFSEDHTSPFGQGGQNGLCWRIRSLGKQQGSLQYTSLNQQVSAAEQADVGGWIGCFLQIGVALLTSEDLGTPQISSLAWIEIDSATDQAQISGLAHGVGGLQFHPTLGGDDLAIQHTQAASTDADLIADQARPLQQAAGETAAEGILGRSHFNRTTAPRLANAEAAVLQIETMAREPQRLAGAELGLTHHQGA